MALEAALGHESISVTTVVGLTTITPQDGILPRAAMITVENAAVRFTVDGTTATTTVGHIAEHGDIITLTSRDEITRFSVVSRDGPAATLKVTYGAGYTP